MILDRALGDIQPGADFLVGKISQHALEHFALAWAQADFRADRPSGIQQLLCAPSDRIEQACTRHDQHCVVRWSLAANQTMHGQETGRSFDRQCALRGRFDFKSRRAGCSFAENESAWLQRVYFCGNRIEYRVAPCLIQNDLALSESRICGLRGQRCGFTVTGLYC